MKTRIYIDGYNLYYGALKKTKYKWLDPIKLARHVITTSAPEKLIPETEDMVITRYFTSPVDPRISFSNTAERDQRAYHSALYATYVEQSFSIIKGSHIVAPARQRLVDRKRPKTLHPDCEVVDVWRVEEKQTDVNIAIEAMRDAFTDTVEQHMVFITNDTDFFRLFETLSGFKHISIGIIAPRRDENRRAAKGLEKYSSWLRNYFTSDELAHSQLPYCIRNAVRITDIRLPIRKPIEWFGENEIAVEVFNKLLTATGKRNNVHRWLEQPPIPTGIGGLDNLPGPAIECLDNPETAQLVLKHVDAYIAHLSS